MFVSNWPAPMCRQIWSRSAGQKVQKAGQSESLEREINININIYIYMRVCMFTYMYMFTGVRALFL